MGATSELPMPSWTPRRRLPRIPSRLPLLVPPRIPLQVPPRIPSRIPLQVPSRIEVRIPSWIPLCLVFAALCLPGTSAAEVRVSASVQPEMVEIGQQAVLTVVVEGATRLDQGPSIPDLPGVGARGAGQSTNVSIVNGRMSRSVTYQFVLVPHREGSWEIGPIEVRDGGRIHRSNRVTFSAVSGPAGSPTPGQSIDPGPSAAGESAERGNLFVRALVDRERAYVGEQVTLRFQFFQRVGFPLLDAPQYSPPVTEGFWREDLPPQRSSNQVIDGIPYQVTELVYALFATRSGELEIGPGRLDCVVREQSRSRDPFSFFGGMFSERSVVLRSRPIEVRIDPLPEPRPVDFTGGVGRYTATSSIERGTAVQNSPVTVLFAVEGTGNVATVGDPPPPDLMGVRAYPSGSEVKTRKNSDIVGGRKEFRLVLVPEGTGRWEIPPIQLSVFDPAKRQYVRIESRPLALEVTAAHAGSDDPAGDVYRVGRDLRTIRATTRLSRGAGQWERGVGFWALQAVPLLLIGLAFGWRARRERMDSQWGLAMSRGAAGRLRRDLETLRGASATFTPAEGFARLDQTLERYFTDRYHLPVRGRTREELLARLKAHDIDEETIADVRALLERCDFARFAPATQTHGDLAAVIEEALRLPQRVEGRKAIPGSARVAPTALLVILALGGAHAGIGAQGADAAPGSSIRMTRAEATSAFERGNEAYARSDFRAAAREYGQVLAAGFESPELLLNLGNASYRAGRLGWAVYYFERGRRLAPSDPDLRANLELALQETRDRVPSGDDSRFLKGLVYLQDQTSLAGAVQTTLVFWWLALVTMASRIALRQPRGRPGAALGFVFGSMFVLSAGWTGIKALQEWAAPDAVVVVEELAVRSNPDPEATLEFTLHAGTRVRLGRELGDHREVLFSDKLRGWGPANGLARLRENGGASWWGEDSERRSPVTWGAAM